MLIKCKFALEKEQEEPEIGSGHRGDFPFLLPVFPPDHFLPFLRRQS